MDTLELVIWSAMLGGLATMAAFALADAVVRHSIAAWRAFVFIALTGTACGFLTGLPQELMPDLSDQAFHVLQNTLGSLSGALALSYLGLWMGVAVEDRTMRLTIVGGALALVVVACALATLTLISPPEAWHVLLAAAFVINGLCVALPVVASLRALALGDRMARGVLSASGFLACMVGGLYARALQIDLGLVAWFLTAVCTVAFFMLGTYLGLRRDRLNRRLKVLADLTQAKDPATGLPKGSVLISKVDDAFWRSARRNQECTVICLHVHNLYELADAAGHQADQQILATLSARMRRAVGFRNVLGLYHPRCFVVVISTEGKTRLVEKTLQRLHYLMAKPLHVVGLNSSNHAFVPRFGIAAVSVPTDHADAASVMDQAERLALAAGQDAVAPKVNSTTSAEI